MLKYKLNEFLARLTREQKRAALIEIRQLLGISRSRLNDIRRARYGDNTNITADQLRLLSEYFAVYMEEILNL